MRFSFAFFALLLLIEGEAFAFVVAEGPTDATSSDEESGDDCGQQNVAGDWWSLEHAVRAAVKQGFCWVMSKMAAIGVIAVNIMLAVVPAADRGLFSNISIWASMINAWVPVAYVVGCIASYWTFLIAYVAVKIVRRIIGFWCGA